MATGLSKTKWNGNIAGQSNPYHSNSLDITLSYRGKRTEAEILATQPTKIKLLWQGNNVCSNSTNNRLYYGDNLPVMAHLLQDPQVRGNVRLVYIDPPFSTNSVFQSRSQVDAYQDLLVGSHYIEFIRERLILLRKLLAADGSIYVHLDYNMVSHIKIIMDEVFGRHNFRNWITRKKCNPKNYTRKVYGNISDFIIFYTKSSNYVWNRPLDKWTPERAEKEYQYVDESTGRPL